MIEGEEHLPPNNAEVNNITLSYVEGEYVFQTNGCSQLFIGAEFANNDSFWATSWYDEFQLCTENVNAEFEFNYLDNFWHVGIFEANVYTYEITQENEVLKLIISAGSTTKAYYSNQQLSISEITGSNQSDFQFAFQNGKLVINSSESVAKSVSVYDLNGKLVLKSKVENNKTNTNNLPKGIYIVKITDEKGNVFSKKVRKD